MKNIILFIFFFISISSFSQITLEHSLSTTNGDSYSLVKISNSEYKYLKVNSTNNSFVLYDLNLSIFYTGTFPFNLVGNTNQGVPNYFTRTLFDCDSSNIEYIVNTKDCPFLCGNYKALVYRLDGTLLFQKDSFKLQSIDGGVNIRDNYIRNTNQGTKLIMDKETYDSTLIYSLCGNLPEPLAISESPNEINSNLYPNPTSNQIVFEFSTNEFTKGQVEVYNLVGELIQVFQVDNSFGKLYINTSSFSNGNYFINLKDIEGKIVINKKFIVNK